MTPAASISTSVAVRPWSEMKPMLWRSLLSKEARGALDEDLALDFVLRLYPSEWFGAERELFNQLGRATGFTDHRDAHNYLNKAARMWTELGLSRGALHNLYGSDPGLRSRGEYRRVAVAAAIGDEHLSTFNGTYECFSSAMALLAHGLCGVAVTSTPQRVLQMEKLATFWSGNVINRLG